MFRLNNMLVLRLWIPYFFDELGQLFVDNACVDNMLLFRLNNRGKIDNACVQIVSLVMLNITHDYILLAI